MNLYMGDFEDSYYCNQHQCRENIIFFKRYIDDLIFISDGPESKFTLFTQYLNTNIWGLNFSWEISSHDINYWDVTLFTENDRILSKTFFKKWTEIDFWSLTVSTTENGWLTSHSDRLGDCIATALEIPTSINRVEH